MQWKTRRGVIDLGKRALVMGILNTTPDSSTDGGRHFEAGAALAHARRMIEEGADIIDVGGESTRPGAAPVTAGEERERVLPVIENLRAEWDGLISIDTRKPRVAEAALAAGADIVNDVAGLRDPGMAEVCARHGCGVVVMHMQGEPRTMQDHPVYENVVAEVAQFFATRRNALEAAGIAREALVFDPGIGFGKTVDHNLELLRKLAFLAPAGRPLLLGISRKSFIGKVLGSAQIDDRDAPTVALTTWARQAGVMLHRVHEVKPNCAALRLVEALLNEKSNS